MKSLLVDYFLGAHGAYMPPRPLEEIEADIRLTERDIVRMLAEVTGSADNGYKM